MKDRTKTASAESERRLQVVSAPARICHHQRDGQPVSAKELLPCLSFHLVASLETPSKRPRAEGKNPRAIQRFWTLAAVLPRAKISAYVAQVVADAPPLTPEQQARLRSLFTASAHAQEQTGDAQGAAR